jgi:hypothetical protein
MPKDSTRYSGNCGRVPPLPKTVVVRVGTSENTEYRLGMPGYVAVRQPETMDLCTQLKLPQPT